MRNDKNSRFPLIFCADTKQPHTTNTTAPPKKQQLPVLLANLKQMYIEDINLTIDKVYEGYPLFSLHRKTKTSKQNLIQQNYILASIIINQIYIMQGAYTLLKDEKGSLKCISFYGFPFKFASDANSTF